MSQNRDNLHLAKVRASSALIAERLGRVPGNCGDEGEYAINHGAKAAMPLDRGRDFGRRKKMLCPMFSHCRALPPDAPTACELSDDLAGVDTAYEPQDGWLNELHEKLRKPPADPLGDQWDMSTAWED